MPRPAKPKVAPTPASHNAISNCNFDFGCVNEHTRAAVEALANAAARNADAIAEAARALQPGETPSYGVYLETR